MASRICLSGSRREIARWMSNRCCSSRLCTASEPASCSFSRAWRSLRWRIRCSAASVRSMVRVSSSTRAMPRTRLRSSMENGSSAYRASTRCPGWVPPQDADSAWHTPSPGTSTYARCRCATAIRSASGARPAGKPTDAASRPSTTTAATSASRACAARSTAPRTADASSGSVDTTASSSTSCWICSDGVVSGTIRPAPARRTSGCGSRRCRGRGRSRRTCRSPRTGRHPPSGPAAPPPGGCPRRRGPPAARRSSG